MPEFTPNAYTLGELGAALDAQAIGDQDLVVHGIGSLANALPGQISHLSNSRYAAQLDQCQASVVILREADRELWSGAALVSNNPYLTYAKATQLFVPAPAAITGVHATAQIHPQAQVADSACIGAGVVVGAGSKIGPGATLEANVALGRDCRVGAHSRLMPNVVLYDNVHLGERCVVHSSAVIGADGFGYTPDAQGHMVEIAQLGGVRIGNDVSIGATTTIDRGALDNTEIADGVKIDNQVQIGHNTKIGAHTLICGCVGIVGSSTIGKHCVLAGGSGVGGDGPVTLCDGVVVTAMTLIAQSVTEPGVYSGATLPAPTGQWKRNAIRFLQLDNLARRVSRLEKSQQRS